MFFSALKKQKNTANLKVDGWVRVADSCFPIRVYNHRNETLLAFRFHETILRFGEPGSLGFVESVENGFIFRHINFGGGGRISNFSSSRQKLETCQIPARKRWVTIKQFGGPMSLIVDVSNLGVRQRFSRDTVVCNIL